MKVMNPAINEVITELEVDDVKTLNEKYSKLKNGFKSWSKTSLDHRLLCIEKFWKLLGEEQQTLAGVLTSEMGKPINEAIGEIDGARGRIKFFLDESKKWLSSVEQNQDGNTSEVLEYEPFGVVGYISAWNYPYLIATNVIIPALISGNTVLFKPSEFTPLTGLKWQELLYKSGIPVDAFQIIIGDGSIGKDMVELPLDGYFFTGSYSTGKAIFDKVHHRQVPIGLELGGKDPLYITECPSDFEGAVASGVEGAFYNNGQSCCGVERIYIHEKIYDEYVKVFEDKVKDLIVGDPSHGSVTQGPITRKVHLEFLEDQVKDALGKGANLISGGKIIQKEGNYFQPTVLKNVNHSMKVMMEESFGPIIGLQKVKNDEEAIKLMNDTEYGLTASVFCSDLDRAKGILAKVDSGTGYVNCCDRVSPYLPWSGRKNSGVGSTLSYLGILAFSKPKAYHIRNLGNK